MQNKTRRKAQKKKKNKSKFTVLATKFPFILFPPPDPTFVRGFGLYNTSTHKHNDIQ